MSAFKQAVDKVRNAVAESDTVTPQSVYIVEEGYVKASDSRMTAGTPWPDKEHKFVVSAEPFNKALNLMDAPKLTITDKGLVVSEGRRRVTIPILPGDAVMHMVPTQASTEIPGGFTRALQVLEPFMSDNKLQDWACGVLFSGSRAVATNNVSVALAELDGGIDQDDFLVPDWAVRFVLKSQAKLAHYDVTKGAICFWFEDGTWLLSRRIVKQPPASLFTLLDRVEEPVFELEGPWKSAYEFAVSFADDVVSFTPTEIVGGKLDRADARVEVATPGVPEGTAYHPKYLNKVVKIATHLEVGAWPAPAPFKGPGIRGVIIGRK